MSWNTHGIDFDLSGNLDYSEHDASFYGSAYAYTQAIFTHDGLNRTTSKTDRDSALTTYAFDPMGDLTNRSMPGNLQWRATYNNAGQMLQEWNVGSGARHAHEQLRLFHRRQSLCRITANQDRRARRDLHLFLR